MIGLITFHWADDYGGMLQAYALKTYLSKHEAVKIIPYFPEGVRGRYRLIKTDTAYDFKMSLSSMLNKSFKIRLKRRLSMLLFRRRYLNRRRAISDASRIANYDKRISTFVVGSDQIWNPEITAGVDDGYFCSFSASAGRAVRCVSYAASMGSERLSAEFDAPIKEKLANFDAVSVREAHIAPYVSELYGGQVTPVCDPVFLLDREEWSALTGNTGNAGPYILVYYTERNMELIEYAKHLAREKGLEIRLFRQEYPEYWQESTHFMSGSGPLDFITYVKNADFVVTNSFHGLAFSIIFQKQLAVFAHSDKNARLNMLLSSAGLGERVVTDTDNFNIDDAIDWQASEHCFAPYIASSKQFIRDEILHK